MRFFISTALAASLLAGAAQAATYDLFTDLVVFGDSLADKGRFGQLQPPSLEGRFSDGPTWLERVGAAFEAQNGGNFNLALGGATAGDLNITDPIYQAIDAATPRDPNDPDDIPLLSLRNLSAQIQAFDTAGFDDEVGDNPLVAIQMGSNDFSQAVAAGADLGPVLAGVIADIADGILQTAALGPQFDSFLVPTQFDGALLPRNIASSSPEELAALSALTAQFNVSLVTAMNDLSTATGLEIEIFDFGGAFSDIVAEAAAAGLNTTGACTNSVGAADVDPNNRCFAPGSSAAFLFVDGVHPGGFGHAGLAEAALEQLGDRIAPVPLPASAWFLTLVLGAFMVLRRQSAY